MDDVKISDLTRASEVNGDDLLMLSQGVGNNFSSVSATVEEIVASGFVDIPNITILAADWSEQNVPDFSGYPFVATIPLTGVTDDDIAEVVPGIAAITWGKLCPLNRTVTNGINVYASEEPSGVINIERVTIRRSAS